MSTKAERAAIRIRERLGCRTVYGRVHEDGCKRPRGAQATTRELHEWIMALHAKGYSRKEISVTTLVSVATVGKHITGRITGKR